MIDTPNKPYVDPVDVLFRRARPLRPHDDMARSDAGRPGSSRSAAVTTSYAASRGGQMRYNRITAEPDKMGGPGDSCRQHGGRRHDRRRDPHGTTRTSGSITSGKRLSMPRGGS